MVKKEWPNTKEKFILNWEIDQFITSQYEFEAGKYIRELRHRLWRPFEIP